ncbi:hypothetical protein AGMMS50239_29920 [Bacteroidia bacterium]|nr:hypothetical protein AGMMS50239_29920 [Bacteroidia bacterium]GHV29641.1 hypothetical protein FACS1894177_00850 [Bacteroidia bacterium]
MNALIVKLLVSYMIMPLLAVIFTFAAYLIAKKNKLFSNKKAIFYVLLVGLALSIPGLLGFLDYEFMPYFYLVLFIIYPVVGWFNIQWAGSMIPSLKNEKKPYMLEFMIYFVIMFIGAAFFSLIFNLCNELQYGLWACTCVFPFVFPSLFYETYKKYMEIPLEVHKIWKFSQSTDLSHFEYMDYNKLMVLELEFVKQLSDETPTKVKAKAPDNIPFGIWFQKFLLDYNLKFPTTPVALRNGEGDFGWIFYIKRSFFLPRKYVDFDLTIPENRIKENHTIVVKRVTEKDNTDTDNTETNKENKHFNII